MITSGNNTVENLFSHPLEIKKDRKICANSTNFHSFLLSWPIQAALFTTHHTQSVALGCYKLVFQAGIA